MAFTSTLKRYTFFFFNSLNNHYLNGYLFKIAFKMPFWRWQILTTPLASFPVGKLWPHTSDLILLLRWLQLSFCFACVLSPFSHAWLCETLWNAAQQAPLPGGFSRQRLEWVAMPSFRVSSQTRDQTPVSYASSIDRPAPPGKLKLAFFSAWITFCLELYIIQRMLKEVPYSGVFLFFSFDCPAHYMGS